MEGVKPNQLIQYLENSEEVRAIGEHPAFGALAVELDGRLAFANDKFLEQVALGSEEVLGADIKELLDMKGVGLEQIQKQAEEGLSLPVDCISCARTSMGKQLSLRFFPVQAGDRLIGLIGVSHEPGQSRMQMEQTVEMARRNEMLFRIMAENINELIGVMDPECVFIYASPTYYDALGYSTYEIIGQDVRQFVHPDDLPAMKQRFKDILVHRKAFELRFRHKRRNGDYLEVEGIFKPLIDDRGKVECFVCVMRDLSEQRRTEELYRQTEKLSLAGQLAAGMAHEIRNPLTAIKGFVQLLEKKDSMQLNRRYFRIITSELNRIEVILNELLILAKPQAASFEHHSLSSIIHDVVTICESQAILKNVMIQLQQDRFIPWLRCDANQLKQVFINIVKNAIDAMPNGGKIHIEVQRYNNDGVAVHVTDQGSGIPEEMLEKLGTPFFTTKEKGTGLGLMVSYKIIEEHRGRIEIASKVGRGTKVSVYLPLT